MNRKDRPSALAAFVIGAMGLATTGCMTSEYTVAVPVSPEKLRAAVQDVAAARSPKIRTADGETEFAHASTVVTARRRPPTTLGELAKVCTPENCPLDTPNLDWTITVTRERSVPDGWLIAMIGSLVVVNGTFIGGNIACFGTDVCSDGSKKAIIITDVAVGIAGVVVIVMVLDAVRGLLN